MENEEGGIGKRIESATTLLDQTLHWLEQRLTALNALSGEVARISATVEPGHRDDELAEKLERVERDLAVLRAGAASGVLSSLRKTVPSATSEMLAKRGVGEGPVDVRTLDAALAGLSLEQRIAVKSQLMRAGAIV